MHAYTHGLGALASVFAKYAFDGKETVAVANFCCATVMVLVLGHAVDIQACYAGLEHRVL